MNKYIPVLKIVSEEVFQISLVGYLIFLLVETLKEGFVSNFFNMNILLGVVLVSGVVMAILTKDKGELTEVKKRNTKPTFNDWVYMYIFSLVGGCVVYYKTSELGTISIVISIISGVLIMLLSYLVYTE